MLSPSNGRGTSASSILSSPGTKDQPVDLLDDKNDMISRLETVIERPEEFPGPARSEKSFEGCSDYGDDTQTVTTGMKDCTFSPEPQPASSRLRNIRRHEPKDCTVAAIANVLKREFVAHPDHEACEKP